MDTNKLKMVSNLFQNGCHMPSNSLQEKNNIFDDFSGVLCLILSPLSISCENKSTECINTKRKHNKNT